MGWMETALAVCTLAATVVVAAATVFYVRLTHQLVRVGQSATRQSLRAIISVEHQRRGSLLIVRIRNVGQRAATELKVQVTTSNGCPADSEYVAKVCMTDLVRFFPKTLGPGEEVIRYWGTPETAQEVRKFGHDLIGLEMRFFDGFKCSIERQTFAVSDFDGLDFPIRLPVELDDVRRIASALDQPAGPDSSPVRLVSLIAEIVEILRRGDAKK